MNICRQPVQQQQKARPKMKTAQTMKQMKPIDGVGDPIPRAQGHAKGKTLTQCAESVD